MYLEQILKKYNEESVYVYCIVDEKEYVISKYNNAENKIISTNWNYEDSATIIINLIDNGYTQIPILK